ncbi:MAG: class I SAM-dependent methyltransferase [Cyanobacteria bacterium RU_5_0]|nr:class I SAM-dependent methyltransferase [Cyanobacteria bacterium RU_5_0]
MRSPQILTILGMLGVGLGFGSVVLSDRPAIPFAQSIDASLYAQTPASPDATESEEPLNAPYVPTPQIVVDRMLEMATVGSDDVVYDLGSGDGRLVITAAKNYGARGVGIEINSRLIEQSNANAQAAGVADRVEFRQEDLFQADFSDATVVTLYLLPEVNLQLRPLLLEQLRPGTQIVSHGFDMGDWEPEEVVTVQGPNRLHIIYRWTVPEEIPEYLRQSPSSQ